MSNTYKITDTFRKIASLKNRLRVIQGGQSAGKTIAILMLFVYLCISERKDLILSVVAASMPNLRGGALRDFEKILKDMGLYDKFKINQTTNTYTFSNGNIIEFFSVDGEASRLGSRRSHLYVNEVSEIKLDTFLEIQGRTSDFTIVDYNPRKKFFIHTDFINQPNVDFLIVNYLDNEFIPQGELQTILSYKDRAEKTNKKYWLNKWKVLGLGELGVADGLIFETYDTVKEVPEGANYLGAGLDFGFSNDPTAIIKVYKYDGKIILKESLYKKGLLNSQIASHILNDLEIKQNIIICDSAEPKTIAELRTYGIAILPVKKGRGSIIEGIAIMQEYDLVITECSKNLITEFDNYCYQKDRTGESIGVPIDDYNHGIDGTRYFFMERLSKASQSNYNTLKFIY